MKKIWIFVLAVGLLCFVWTPEYVYAAGIWAGQREAAQTETQIQTTAETQTQTTAEAGTGTEAELLGTLGDMQEIEDTVSEALSDTPGLSFKALFSALLQGDWQMAVDLLGEAIQGALTGGLAENRALLFKIAGLAVISAVFTNFSTAFSKGAASETGFYLTYILMMTLLMSSFILASRIVTSVLSKQLLFMKALLPAFCLTVTMTTGSLTAGGYYELMMLVITLIDWLMAGMLMKGLQVYILTTLVNNISRTDYLSKLSELLELLIRWTLKTMVGLVLGLNVLQRMLLPAVDRAKGTAVFRLFSAIPGVGSAVDAAVSTVMGSGILIRNALGTGGLLMIILVSAVPVLRLCLIFLMYKILLVFIQPVADKRVLEGIASISTGVGMLLRMLGTAILMLLLSIAVICGTGTAFGG